MRLLTRRPLPVDYGPELAEARSRIAILEMENSRLEDVCERRRQTIERLTEERDAAWQDTSEARAQVSDLTARLDAAREAKDAVVASLAFAAEAVTSELAKYQSRRTP
jgi:predicted nuclease with TOPRIM domain